MANGLQRRNRPIEITKPKLILGEGKDEVAFFDALLKDLGITDIQPLEYGGRYNMLTGLATIVDLPGFQTVTAIGITRDADHHETDVQATTPSEAQSAFNSISRILHDSRINLPIPAAPLLKATAEGKPAVSVFILPDCTRPGMLENLCLDSLEASATLKCIDDYLACIAKDSGRSHAIHRLAKARINAWIASSEEPDLALGQAAIKGYLDFKHPAFDKLKEFLQAL